MKNITNKLGRQLLSILVFNFCIILLFIGNVIPSVIKDRYEKTIFDSLKTQLEDLDVNINEHVNIGDVIYIYVEDNTYYVSPNFFDHFDKNDSRKLVKYLEEEHGKVKYGDSSYYYYKIENKDILKVALIDAGFVEKTEYAILALTLVILLLVYFGVNLIIAIWSSKVVKKIEKLKDKIDNIDNPNYKFESITGYDDELKALDASIDDVRESLLRQEELRTQLYQNISHDFKTPLTVIKSYVEAVEDEVEDERTALQVIKQQTAKLEQKVHSLLYLNKLDYLKSTKVNTSIVVDMVSIIESEVEKFKFHNKEINFIIDVDKKSKYYGTNEHWETIFDNLLSNFMRYAKTTIKITAKQNKIILYNDGENIDKDLLEGIFTPFRKGIKGEFGLGLSIVKKTLNIMDYDITIRNEKKGVSFIITKENHK